MTPALPRERAAWSLAAWLGAGLIAVLTIVLTFIGQSQQSLVESLVQANQRLSALEELVYQHIGEHEQE
ncbi:MAG: hypothetical protein ACYSUI_13530 [Planctomycetota bacterium]|jgi:hypothetical protein